MTYLYSADLLDTDIAAAVTMCRQLGCKPLDFFGCWMNESGVSSRAQNQGAYAAGFWQAMPATLRGMQFKGDGTYREPAGAYAAAVAASDTNARRALDKALSDAFVRIGFAGQVQWAGRFYAPHAGRFVDATACYAANFVPAWMGHSSEPAWVICAKDGHSDGGLSAHASTVWYAQNPGLDVDKDGRITMGDLGRAIARATQGPRWEEIAARVTALAPAVEANAAPFAPATMTTALLDISGKSEPDPEEGA